jgi:hypothetical protein
MADEEKTEYFEGKKKKKYKAVYKKGYHRKKK